MNSATTCSSPQTSSHTSSNNDTNTNTAESITANVISKKQRYGKQAGSMYFYTSRDIVDGEELFFDYGADYWTKFAELGLKYIATSNFEEIAIKDVRISARCDR